MDVLLVLISIVNLKLYISWFAVGWRLVEVRLEWCPDCRLKHDWSSSVITMMHGPKNIKLFEVIYKIMHKSALMYTVL